MGFGRVHLLMQTVIERLGQTLSFLDHTTVYGLSSYPKRWHVHARQRKRFMPTLPRGVRARH